MDTARPGEEGGRMLTAGHKLLPLNDPSVLLLAACRLPTKIRLNFCSASVTRPIGGYRLPQNVFQIQSGASFDQKPDHLIMAITGGLMQRCRVGMASDRVISVWVFARVCGPDGRRID